MNKNIKIFLAGDILISRRMPNRYSKELQDISNFIRNHDCVFGNFETTAHYREGYPEAFPGGSYTMTSPLCIKDLKDFGFNVFNTANNHSMDYGHGGLLATLKYMDAEGIPHSGTGKNLSDATLPAFVECKGGRVAILSVTSSYHDSYMAGPQNQDLEGRPGVAPLRHKAIYELDKTNYESLTKIAAAIGINGYHDQARKEGYIPQSENQKFGIYDYKLGDENTVHTSPLPADLKRSVSAIKDAKMQADVVIMSVHGHQFINGDKHNAPEFLQIFAHECIDAGADIVVCHGPHVMRGIENYKNGIIIHGLGNFILQHEVMQWVAEEQYQKVGLTRETSTGVGEVINKRNKGGKTGLNADPASWYSYVVSINWTPQGMNAKAIPIRIEKGHSGGFPSLCKDNDILNEIVNLSLNWQKLETTDDSVIIK